MERWEIRPTPNGDDPDRHVLLLQGGPVDVASLLKKFGSQMGRPTPAEVPGFNLSLVVHRLRPDARAKMEIYLRQVAPASAAPVVEPVPAPPVAVSAPPPPPMPTLAPPPTSPMPELPVLAPPPPMPDLAPPAPLAVEPPAIPALKPPEVDKPALVPFAPEPAPVVPVPTPPPPPPPVPVPVADAAPVVPAPSPALTPAPPPAVLSETPLLVELRSDWTMDTLMVGAYNRFAHAAAASVISSPGTMYNPLFLYGVPGTGKSHMLHAIGSALSKGLGGAVLLSTTNSKSGSGT